MKNKYLIPNRFVGISIATTVISLVAAAVGPFAVQMAMASTVTSLSDNMTRLKANTPADHEIKFVTPSGISPGLTITLTFGTGTGFTGINTGFATSSVDFATRADNNCSSGSGWTEQTLAATAAGATWGVATSSAQAITLTSGTGTAASSTCVRFRLGANAVTGANGSTFITNGSAASADATVTVGGTFGDSGTLFVPIISNDQVTITATVVPSISFSISANSVGFGTLATGNPRFATSDTLGSSTELSAHNLIVGTNAASGYGVYVLGNTLASASNTIAAIGGTAASSTFGSAQFGMRVSASGGIGASVSPYNFTTSYAYAGTATTTSQIATATGPSANTTYLVYYVANIAALTPAGNYSTTLTYTAVGTF